MHYISFIGQVPGHYKQFMIPPSERRNVQMSESGQVNWPDRWPATIICEDLLPKWISSQLVGWWTQHVKFRKMSLLTLHDEPS